MEEREFREKLNPERYRVMRQKGTEAAFTGKYWDNEEKGIYVCAACGNKLFSSKTKFDPGSGWPSFLKPLSPATIEVKDGTEVTCRKCGSHLGELIGDKDKHYRVNSIALEFEEAEGSALMEDLKDELEGAAEDKLQEEQDKISGQDPSPQNSTPAWSLKNVLVLLGAVALGGGLVAGLSTVYGGSACQVDSGEVPPPIVGIPAAKIPLETPAKSSEGGSVIPPKPSSTKAAPGTATTTSAATPLPSGSNASSSTTTTPVTTTTNPGSV